MGHDYMINDVVSIICIRLLTMNVFGEDLIKTGKTEHGNKNTVPLNSELIKIKLIDQ